MKNGVLIALGWVCFGLGLLGAFLPILPTTPFILLSAYFFSKGSPKLYKWLISQPHFGKSIQNWHENGAISKRSKLICVISILIAIAFITIYLHLIWYVNLLLASIMLGVLIFVVTRPSDT